MALFNGVTADDDGVWHDGATQQDAHLADCVLALLEDGVIDAWICSAPDAPVRPGLTALRLTTMPMHLMVPRGHPLATRCDAIAWDEFLPYPVLPLPSSSFPIFEAVLERCQLVPSAAREAAIKTAPWYGQVPVEAMLIICP